MDHVTSLSPGSADPNPWQQALGAWEQYVETHDDMNRNRLVWRGKGAGSFKFGDGDGIHALKRRVPMREGSMLIWDQRLVHGAAPNESDRLRMAQFIKAFRRDGAGEERLRCRAARVRAELDKAGLRGEVSALGRRVFGLDVLD
jgi:ectoine hydroxylase-related dioxygenase (phytanoyl-CoA dioxygenase family)